MTFAERFKHVRSGDRVRVEIDGTVYFGTDYISICDEGLPPVHIGFNATPVTRVTVLERPLPKEPPVGSVVLVPMSTRPCSAERYEEGWLLNGMDDFKTWENIHSLYGSVTILYEAGGVRMSCPAGPAGKHHFTFPPNDNVGYCTHCTAIYNSRGEVVDAIH